MTSHMAREVAEIPQASKRFLTESRPALQAAAAAMRGIDPGLIVTVARGSSDHAATYLKYAVELVAGVPVASVGPSVASVYGRPLRLGGAVCVGISQSGRSPDILAQVEMAKRSGAMVVALVNDITSPLAALAQEPRALWIMLDDYPREPDAELDACFDRLLAAAAPSGV